MTLESGDRGDHVWQDGKDEETGLPVKYLVSGNASIQIQTRYFDEAIEAARKEFGDGTYKRAGVTTVSYDIPGQSWVTTLSVGFSRKIAHTGARSSRLWPVA